VGSPVSRTRPERKPLASFAVVRRSSGRLPRRTSSVVASSVADGADFARAVEEEDARARAAPGGGGAVHARVLRERVSEKLGEREAHDAANPRGRGPAPLALARRSSSRARVSHTPTRSKTSRYRADGGAGTSRTARSRVASRDAARRVAIPATLEPGGGRRPRAGLWSMPQGPSETCEKTRSGRHGAELATFAVQRCLKRGVASGSTPKAAALCGHKASRARGRQRPTPSPSTFRVRRHDDSGPARRVIRARREVRAPAAASAPDPRFLRGDSRCRSTRRGCRPTRRARARRSWRR